eukprot:CAMPEP_0198147290 /NCGR_PEP_ID=MMETSP1443-20131203/34440_1 /TAXON_ID=186043 /ORGANISM="Entomoneis sp., Strain CCMP2396" /LENGTH=293 /DNA_ID=CAMNT_0043811543 /DNA_START=64 /DNA_END=941 /DNA_ORIENTATION=-
MESTFNKMVSPLSEMKGEMKSVISDNANNSKENDNDIDHDKQGLLERPGRALTAYNFFFREQRLKMIAKKKETGVGVSFAEMARQVSKLWKATNEDERKPFKKLAAVAKADRKTRLVLWKKARKESERQDGKRAIIAEAPHGVRSSDSDASSKTGSITEREDSSTDFLEHVVQISSMAMMPGQQCPTSTLAQEYAQVDQHGVAGRFLENHQEQRSMDYVWSLAMNTDEAPISRVQVGTSVHHSPAATTNMRSLSRFLVQQRRQKYSSELLEQVPRNHSLTPGDSNSFVQLANT